MRFLERYLAESTPPRLPAFARLNTLRQLGLYAAKALVASREQRVEERGNARDADKSPYRRAGGQASRSAQRGFGPLSAAADTSDGTRKTDPVPSTPCRMARAACFLP